MECPRGVGSSVKRQRLALGDAELLAHEVDARGLLRHRVFHLQPRVDLEERDQPVLADEELDRARPVVARLPADRLGGLVDRRALLVGEERRGRLLHQLLEPALQGAVAGADHDHAAVGVGQHLGLDVAGLVQVALHEALAAPERGLRLPHGRLVQRGDLLLLARDLEPAAAAAERRLDRDREAVLLRERDDLVRAGDRVAGAGHERGARAHGDVPGGDLVAEVADGLRGGADPDEVRVDDGLREVRVLGQEAVAGVHAVGARPARDVDQLVDGEVGLARGRPAERERLVGEPHERGVTVGVGVRGDAGQPGVAAGADDADGDLTTVRDEDLAQARHGSASYSRVSAV